MTMEEQLHILMILEQAKADCHDSTRYRYMIKLLSNRQKSTF